MNKATRLKRVSVIGSGILLAVGATVGCAESIIAREKPMLACAKGEEAVPIGHYQGNFKWQCGKAPTKCAAGEKSKFFVGNNESASGVNDIRWECLREEGQQELAGLSPTFEAAVRGKTISASLSRAMKCRKAWLDNHKVVQEAEDWKPCEPKSVADQQITIKVGDSTLRAATNAQGKATFDLTEVKPNEALISTPKVDLVIFGNVATMAHTSVDLSWCELFPVWKKTVKLTADTKHVEQIEADVSGIERILTKLEGTKEPWSDAELEETNRMVALFNDMQQNVNALNARKPIDPTLDRRFGPLAPRVDTFGPRAQALLPRAKKAAEARNMRNAAFLTALLGGGSSPSSSFGGGSSGASSSDDARLREMEDRHQRERADDDRRNRQQRDDDARKDRDERERRSAARQRSCIECSQTRGTCETRCDDDRRRCSDGCGHGTPRWAQCDNTTCAPQGNSCRNRCMEDYTSCRSRNDCGG